MVRALACHARGRGFESHPGRQYMYASVAQSVEQRTENPCVGGSIPPRGTINQNPLIINRICRHPFNNQYLCWCGSTVEQLTCNQQVVGSIPITSSTLGRLQSGQMQRTVNPSTQSSMVRIHPFPPKESPSYWTFFVTY